MNITQALTDHHTVLRQLFEESKTNLQAADELMRHLTVHHTMEEKYFYDILEAESQAHKDALEAVNEHHIIELIIKDAERFPREHERFTIKIESLGEYMAHHLDEEEMKIFPMAEQLFPQETLNTLGALFTEAKNKLLNVTLPSVPGKLGGREPKGLGVAKKKAATAGPPSGAGKTYPQDLGIGSLKK
jgi:hemerythrin-like domain-containing protein